MESGSKAEPNILVNRVMREPVTIIGPHTSVRAAAALMRALDVGILPVCEEMRPTGVVTDRDIVTRWVSQMTSDCSVSHIMTKAVITCHPDQTTGCAAHIMSDSQVRRLVVVDNFSKVVGIITLGDIAHDANEALAGETMGEIVETR